jgi:hypothetical protein
MEYGSADWICLSWDRGFMIKLRRMGWARIVARMGETRNAYKILVGNPEGNRPLGRHKHKLGDNIRMDLKEIEWEYAEWMHMAQD